MTRVPKMHAPAFAATPCLACLQNATPRRSRTPARLAAAAAALAAFAVLPTPDALAKGVLSTNTLFRRYIVTDSDAILRYALPLPAERRGEESPTVRRVQALLEQLGVDLRARGAAGALSGRRDLLRLRDVLAAERLDVLLGVPAVRRSDAVQALSRLERSITDIEREIGFVNDAPSIFPAQVGALTDAVLDAFTPRTAALNFDPAVVEELRRQALDTVSEIEEIMVQGESFPYRIPRRYASLPRLLGRATVEMRVTKPGGQPPFQKSDGTSLGREMVFTVVLDGYSAPLTAGNFFDLARRGFYDGTTVLGGERDFYVQLGDSDPKSGASGFVDPKTGIRREVPMEILIEGDPTPLYGATLDELGVADLQPALPVTAYGAMAMAHSVENANDSSSQFFVFLINPRSYTARAPGGSALTGSMAAFGFVTEGKEYLSQIRPGDVVRSCRVMTGEENFRIQG